MKKLMFIALLGAFWVACQQAAEPKAAAPQPANADEAAKQVAAGSITPDNLDESAAASLFDSLLFSSTKDKSSYLLAINKLMANSDGAMSESLGMGAYEYVLANACTYFGMVAASPEKDLLLKRWSKFVNMEIMISYEGKEAEQYADYKKTLLKAVTDCPAHKPLVEQFCRGFRLTQ